MVLMRGRCSVECAAGWCRGVGFGACVGGAEMGDAGWMVEKAGCARAEMGYAGWMVEKARCPRAELGGGFEGVFPVWGARWSGGFE